MKSHKSAVVIIPPDDCFPQIQAIRREHDKAFARWMPHINLLYPFLEDNVHSYDQIARKLTDALTGLQPFKVRFTKDSLGHFNHGKRSTVWLKPLLIAKETEVAKASIAREVVDEVSKGSVQITPASAASRSPSVQRTAVRVVQPLVGHPIAPHINHQYMWDVGLDALRDAVWTPEENNKIDINRPPKLEPGLDCLRYAIWTPENTNTELIASTQPTRLETRTVGHVAASDVTSAADSWCGYSPTPEADHGSTDGDQEEEDPTSWQQISRKSKKESSNRKQPPGSVTSGDVTSDDDVIGDHVRELQARLEKVCPECSDLSSRSSEVFQAHLTLGQCDSSKVDKLIKTLKHRWRDLEFEIGCVYIITRNQTDPFQIIKTVPLGMRL